MRNKIWTTTFALIALSVAPSLHKRDWNVFAGRFIPPAHAAPDVAVPPDELTGAASGAGVPNAKERLHGTVASVDQRNDKVSVRLPSGDTTDLKVEDGLLFNALRYGDAVRVTVKTVGGAKTIVGLVRE